MSESCEIRLSDFVERLRDDQLEDQLEYKNESPAVHSFLECMDSVEDVTFDFPQALNFWLHDMLNRHRTHSYVRRNIQALNAVYKKLYGTLNKQYISKLAKHLEAKRPVEVRAADAVFKLRHLVATMERSPEQNAKANDTSLTAKQKVYLCVLLTAVILPDRSAEQLARLKVSAVFPEIYQLHDIIAQNLLPRRQYIFDLGQTDTRFETIIKNLVKPKDKEITSVFGDLVNLLNDDKFRKDVWIQAAKLGGALDYVLRGYLDEIPDSYIYLTAYPKEEIGQHPRLIAQRNAAAGIIPDYRRWYAMGLRGRTTPEIINGRLDDLGIRIETFYPLDEKRVGKKLKKKLLPYISKVLFFKSKPRQLDYLFNRISDLGWPYRVTKEPGAAYAVISDMANFKRCIQAIDPKTDIGIIDLKKVSEGERVLITGGVWSGYEGKVVKVAGQDQYKLIISLCNVAFDTTVNLEPQYIERINPITEKSVDTTSTENP